MGENIRPETIKLLGENIRENLLTWSWQQFLKMIPKAQATRANAWEYIRLKSLCKARETSNRMKRQSAKWWRIFANHVSEKGLISKMYKEFMQLKSKKTNTPINR